MSYNSGTSRENFFNLKVSCVDFVLIHAYCCTKWRFGDSSWFIFIRSI